MKCIRSILLAASLLLTGCGTAPAQEAPAELTAKDVLDAYVQAAQVYDWFDLRSLPTGSEAVEADGEIYYPVESSDITSLADLEARIRECFAPELADALLSGDSGYREIDGRLFSAGGARGQNIYLLAKTMDATQSDRDHWTVTVTFWADFLDEAVQNDGHSHTVATTGCSQSVLDYARTEDGWRFTSFCSSDGLDLDAETVYTIDYYQDFEVTGAWRDYPDWKLVCYLIYADGAYAEAPFDLLYQRFLERPEDILDALALLDNAPYRQKGPPINIDAVVAGPGYSAAWRSPDEQAQFEAALEACRPRSDAAQAVLDKIRTAYKSMTAEVTQPQISPEQECALGPLTAEETDFSGNQPLPGMLQLGMQDGAYPWGYEQLTAVPQTCEGSDFGQGWTAEQDGLALQYFTADDGHDYLVALLTTDPALSTPRGVRCGDSAAAVQEAYPEDLTEQDADTLPTVSLLPLPDCDSAWVYHPTPGFCRIFFCMKEDTVTAIQAVNGIDG